MPPAYLQARNPNVFRPDYAHGCTGKVRFDSPALAAAVAKKRKGFRSDSKGKRKTRDAYRCPHCNGWHLGTLPNGPVSPKAYQATAKANEAKARLAAGAL